MEIEVNVVYYPLWDFGGLSKIALQNKEGVWEVWQEDRAVRWPGPAARRLWHALGSLWAGGDTITWVWRRLFNLLGLAASGRTQAQVREQLRQLANLRLRTNRLKTRKSNMSYDGPLIRSLGNQSLVLPPWYAENLANRNCVPVDGDTWKELDSLNPLASRLYELTRRWLYKNTEYPLSYTTLCQLLPMTACREMVKAKEQLQAACDPLVEKELLKGVVWQAHDTQVATLTWLRGTRLYPAPQPVSAPPPQEKQQQQDQGGITLEEISRMTGCPLPPGGFRNERDQEAWIRRAVVWGWNEFAGGEYSVHTRYMVAGELVDNLPDDDEAGELVDNLPDDDEEPVSEGEN